MRQEVAVPEIDPRRRQHPEVYGPELLEHYAGSAPLAPAAAAERLAWWERDFQRGFARLARGTGSWNWDWMLASVWLWRSFTAAERERATGALAEPAGATAAAPEPARATGAAPEPAPAMGAAPEPARTSVLPAAAEVQAAADWWTVLLRYQLGELAPPAGQEILGLLMGSETCSSTYEPYRWGAVLAVRLLASRWPRHPAAPELRRLSGRYSEALAAICALGAAPWPDAEGHVGRSGFWYTGVTVSPVGERTTLAHAYQNDLGPLWCLAAGWPLAASQREEWPGRVARLLGGDLGVGEESAAFLRQFVISPSLHGSRFPALLRGLRVFSDLHWSLWRRARLTWSGPRRNFNSPKIYYSLASEETATMACGFPWSGAPGTLRGKAASHAAGSVTLRAGSLRVETDEESAEAALPREPPLFCASLSAAGYEEGPAC